MRPVTATELLDEDARATDILPLLRLLTLFSAVASFLRNVYFTVFYNEGELRTILHRCGPDYYLQYGIVMARYETLVEALNDLRARGYTYNFNIRPDCIHCSEADEILDPRQFDIVEVHRFEGMSSTDDSAVLYAIESHGGLKGVLVNAYGVYADPLSDAMIAKLAVHDQP